MISPLFHSEIPWKSPIVSWLSRSIHLIFPAPQPSEPSRYRPVGLASPGRPNLAPAQDHRDDTHLPSGKHTKLWKITMFNGKIHYKWPFSIAFCMFTRGYSLNVSRDSSLNPPVMVSISVFPYRNSSVVHGCLPAPGSISETPALRSSTTTLAPIMRMTWGRAWCGGGWILCGYWKMGFNWI